MTRPSSPKSTVVKIVTAWRCPHVSFSLDMTLSSRVKRLMRNARSTAERRPARYRLGRRDLGDAVAALGLFDDTRPRRLHARHALGNQERAEQVCTDVAGAVRCDEVRLRLLATNVGPHGACTEQAPRGRECDEPAHPLCLAGHGHVLQPGNAALQPLPSAQVVPCGHMLAS